MRWARSGFSRHCRNHRLLGEVSAHLHQHGVGEDAFIYIADSAMVTEANLAQAGEHTRFITHLPATYNEHERVILEAIKADDWQEVGRIAQTAPTKNRAGASYCVREGAVTLYGKDYRAAVVHSSAHDQRRLKRLERELCASRSDIEEVAKAAAKKIFFCRPDAEAAAAEVRAYARTYHQLNVRVQQRPRYGPGRPKKGVARIPVAIDYVLGTEVVEQHEAIDKRRQLAGCFALLISLLIWRLIELVMRTELQAREATVPGLPKGCGMRVSSISRTD